MIMAIKSSYTRNSIKNNRKISLTFLSWIKIILEDQENNQDSEVLEDDQKYHDSESDGESETETIAVESELEEHDKLVELLNFDI
jgi:hypothetical protein